MESIAMFPIILAQAGLSLPLVMRRVKSLGLGVVFALVAIGLYFLLGANFVVYNVACAAVLLVRMRVTSILCFRYLRSVNSPRPPARSD